ncbi:endoribonuclease Dicer homolog 3-like [Actinidia eriantha]|uniref:endoribonuclease Dicer homolog 3-like n=1 Tax=Actinidia eriantha TaxID=165200 RepID=UPI002589CB8D|nr:endoribonuclease Dicer homolog 3-like [Actinidia eriantha]
MGREIVCRSQVRVDEASSETRSSAVQRRGGLAVQRSLQQTVDRRSQSESERRSPEIFATDCGSSKVGGCVRRCGADSKAEDYLETRSRRYAHVAGPWGYYQSLAGAILVDSADNKGTVLQSIRPLLEPMVAPETVRLHPVRELTELCQKVHYVMKKASISCDKGVASLTIEVEAKGVTYKQTHIASDKQTAKRLASKDILNSLKERMDDA